MKKRCFSLLLFAGLFLWGCGRPGSAQAVNSTEATDIDSPSQETVSHTETPADIPEASEVIQSSSGVTVNELSESSSFYSKTDGSVCVLEASASYPYITIAQNPAVSDRMNAAISSELDTFWNFEKENAVYADEDYQMSLGDAEYAFQPYSASFSFALKRCDDRIISIVFNQYDYSGGAHGNSWSYGITFDAVSGDRLHLEGLSGDSSGFYQTLLSNLNTQAALPAYKDFVFEDFYADIENSLLKDSDVWYLDSSGLTFLSNPYVLGPYAAGTFEFNIPYSELEGLKEAYAYEGKYICKLFPGISASCDLNGDQTPEDICYALSLDEVSQTQYSFTIDDTDDTSALDGLHLTNPWTGAYYLIDIDPEDSYVEIGISNHDDENSDDNGTHFFRYGTDRRLSYLGKIPAVYQEGQQIRYNSNGNLVLCDRDGEPLSVLDRQ